MAGIYDKSAFFDAYSKMTRSVLGLEGAGEWAKLRPLLHPVEGARVLDLGCGYGWHSRYAADNGARSVVAIDSSERMIEEAKKRNAHEKIRYSVMAIDEFDYPEEAFELVISNLVLHYIADLDTVFRDVFRTLTRGGKFVFNIEHPVFTAGVRQEWITDDSGAPLYWPVDDYYIPGERETVFLGETVKKQHHTLTQIFSGLLAAGFRISAVVEPEPPNDRVLFPDARDEMRRPMMLIVRAEKE